MKIELKSNLLAIKKHKNTGLAVDMAIEESDEDKSLITGEVLQSNNEQYKVGDTVIFGKYAILKLKLKGEDFFILDVDDVLGTTNYKE